MWPACVWTSTKNEWNAQNAVWSRAFRISTPSHLITRVLTVCQWNLSKSSVWLRLDLRSLLPALRNLWSLQVYKSVNCDLYLLFSPVPDSPRSISINVQNNSHILLQWQPPEHVNGAINGYQVTAQKLPEIMTAIIWRTNDSSTEILMDHIDFQAVYRISVLAINRMGKGPPVTVTFDLSAGWFLLWWDIILRTILGIQRAKALAFLVLKDWQWYNSTWEINLCPK